MQRLKTWWQRQKLRRRLRALEAGVLACVSDPGRLPEVSREWGVTTETIEEWLHMLRTGRERGLGQRRTLVPRPLPASAPVADVPSWKIKPHDEAIPERLAERVRRLILLLLEHPFVWRDPARTCDFVVRLAEAAAHGDLQGIDQLEAALGPLRRPGPLGVKTGPRIRPGVAEGEGRSIATVESCPADASSVESREPWSHDQAVDQKLRRQFVVVGKPSGQREENPHLAMYRAMMSCLADRTTALHLESAIQPASPGDESNIRDGLRPDLPLPRAAGWQALRVMIETLAGNEREREDLRRELDYLDSLQAEPAAGHPQAASDLLVLVRARLQQLVFDLAEPASLSSELVQRAFKVAQRLPELLWSLEQGPELRGSSRPGNPFPEGIDAACALLARAAAALPARGTGLGPEIEWATPRTAEALAVKRQELLKLADEIVMDFSFPETHRRLIDARYLMDEVLKRFESYAGPLSVLYYQAARRIERIFIQSAFTRREGFEMGNGELYGRELVEIRRLENEPAPLGDERLLASTWPEEPPSDAPLLGQEWAALRQVLADEDLATEPDLAVRLAGAVCRDRGTLSWETCLTLANSRARYHRYVLAGDGAAWHVRIDARAGRDGAIEIPFAVTEQPLSERFRQRFEAVDLAGRLRILWQLVQYASRLHTSLLTLTSGEAQRQLDLREEELWTILAGRAESSPIPSEGQTP